MTLAWFTVAVTTAVRPFETFPHVTLKPAVREPPGTVTDAGTGNAAALLVNDTTVPFAPAGADRVTVQNAVAPDPTTLGVQTIELNGPELCAVRLICAVCELLLKVAVTVAVWLVEMEPAVALKVAVVDAAPTVTAAGTVRL